MNDQANLSTIEGQDKPSIGDGYDGLRAQIARIIDAEQLSRADLAKEAALANSTFQAFCNGTYTGNNERVGNQIRRWLATRHEAQRRRAELPAEIAWQPTETGLRIRQALEMAHLLPTISVIACGAGAGKTITCRHYAAEASGVFIATMDPEIRTVARMLIRVADACRIPQHNAVNRSHLIRERLSGGQRLLIVDEAQIASRDQLEMLRSFTDACGCGLALVGNQHVATRRGDSVESWGQLESRIGWRLRVEQPTRADVDALLAARGIEDADALGLLRTVGVRPGLLRMMGQIVHSASLMATGDGAERLDGGHVRAAMTQRGLSTTGAF